MADFKRARSDAQKEIRMQEIKDTVDEMFHEMPYHEITLTSIAERMDWTRVNLYKYFSTKEEIFLELCSDKRDVYYSALKAAFPEGCGYSLTVFSEVWAGILNAHQDHLYYCDILSTIIETNVGVDKLGAFKKRYYEKAYEIADLIANHLNISKELSYRILLNIHYHAVGMSNNCKWNPLVAEALKKENIISPKINFRENMNEFIIMNLKNYTVSKIIN